MTGAARRALGDFNTTRPNIARMNDYFLGGKDNFAVDREAAEQLLAIAPEIQDIATENRRFLGRAVRYLAEHGIRQFIDIGSGLPSRRNTHEVAQKVAPDARVVYVDKDPVVISHGRAILANNERTVVVEGDILHPEDLVTHPQVRRIVDLDEPVAVLIFGALHFIPHSEDPFKCVAWMRDAMPPGSYLAISHVVFDTRPDAVDPIEDIYRGIFERPDAKAARNIEDVRRFFDGWDLIEPGLVYVRQWHPDNPLSARSAEKVWVVGGVARKA
ncbi:SAM-dependent methyltransferase [Actinoallomurus bryophytorum]|uniref:S-adenosyl methyltransferase n=1 Tax=Actinoallomurus bryophytorum TaxID=1490222 RepID=A0A543CDW3_9ACTN|nr:SAM-dependent methyltransferase [Actinoallomurus bryophytorum]TQL95284.1 S-adenosyl methyltransferase [Actinoallomurus bryophytorum]